MPMRARPLTCSVSRFAAVPVKELTDKLPRKSTRIAQARRGTARAPSQGVTALAPGQTLRNLARSAAPASS